MEVYTSCPLPGDLYANCKYPRVAVFGGRGGTDTLARDSSLLSAKGVV